MSAEKQSTPGVRSQAVASHTPGRTVLLVMSIAVAVYSAGWVSGACSYSLARQRHPLCAHLDLWNPTPTSKTADETESNLETAFRDAPGVDSLLEGAVKAHSSGTEQDPKAAGPASTDSTPETAGTPSASVHRSDRNASMQGHERAPPNAQSQQAHAAPRRTAISGSVPAHLTQQSRRALVTYVHTWQAFSQLHPGVDFLLLTFESWRRSMGHFPQRKFDLVAVATPMVVEKLMDHPRIFPVCTPVDIEWSDAEFQRHVQPHSQCWLVPLAYPPPHVWFGYPFALDLLHFRLPGFQAFLRSLEYELVLKVTTGSITSPGLSSWIPERFTVGTAAYTHVDETSRRIRHLARHLGMRHAGKHGIGSTWYGTVSDVLDLAGLTLEFLRYILEETFPHVALEGLSVEEWLEDADWHALVDVRTKEGLLPWNPAMAALYAGDLAINNAVASWGWDPKVDAPATRRVGMGDVVLVRPALHDPTLDVDKMLQSTQAFCEAWRQGKRGNEGTVGHYASLIACQASETAVPVFEQRYAENFH